MKPNLLIFLLLAVSPGALAMGCSPSDPGCVSDAECRFGRLCVEARCTGGVPEAANNGGAENNEGPVNNGVGNNSGNSDGNNSGGNNTDENNVDENNVDENNVDENNVDENNVDENNDDENNDDENNSTLESCLSATDCNEGNVCSWGDDTRALQCVEAWECEFEEGTGEGSECVFEWSCDDFEGPVILGCAPAPDGTVHCFCFNPETGETNQFESGATTCTSDYNELVDAANLACGYRLPVVVF